MPGNRLSPLLVLSIHYRGINDACATPKAINATTGRDPASETNNVFIASPGATMSCSLGTRTSEKQPVQLIDC